MSGFGIKKGLGGTQTKGSKGATPPNGGSSMERGARQDPPQGCQFPGKGLKGTQTRNSLTPKR